MRENEKGMTLVEILTTLILVSLVTGVIWTTISIATQFNVSQTTQLKLQQEANYIISEIQRVHRKCYSYQLAINKREIKISNCKDENGTNLSGYDGVISNLYLYESNEDFKEPKNIFPTKKNLESTLKIIDPVKEKRFVKLPISISRYITD